MCSAMWPCDRLRLYVCLTASCVWQGASRRSLPVCCGFLLDYLFHRSLGPRVTRAGLPCARDSLREPAKAASPPRTPAQPLAPPRRPPWLLPRAHLRWRRAPKRARSTERSAQSAGTHSGRPILTTPPQGAETRPWIIINHRLQAPETGSHSPAPRARMLPKGSSAARLAFRMCLRALLTVHW